MYQDCTYLKGFLFLWPFPPELTFLESEYHITTLVVLPHFLAPDCPSNVPIIEPSYFQVPFCNGSCRNLLFIHVLPESCLALHTEYNTR